MDVVGFYDGFQTEVAAGLRDVLEAGQAGDWRPRTTGRHVERSAEIVKRLTAAKLRLAGAVERFLLRDGAVSGRDAKLVATQRVEAHQLKK